MDYWDECIRDACEDAKLDVTEEQIDTIVGWVEGAHENHGLATGLDVINANHISDEARELTQLKTDQEKHRRWMNNTKPCRSCTTTGTIFDGWGRDVRCDRCRGEGRHR